MKHPLLRWIFTVLLIAVTLISAKKASGQTASVAYLSGGIAGSVSQGQNTAVYGFSVTVAGGGSITFAKYYIASGNDATQTLANATLVRNTTNNYSTGTKTVVGNVNISTSSGTSAITISNLSETIASGSTNYYFLVVDIIGNNSAYFQLYIQGMNFATDVNGNNYFDNYINAYNAYNCNNGSSPVALKITPEVSGLTSNSTPLVAGTTGVAVMGFSITGSSTNNITQIYINSNIGTLTQYFTNFKLYTTSTTSTYSVGARSPVTATLTPSGGVVTVAITGTNLQATTTKTYYWLVADVNASITGTIPASPQFYIKSGQTPTAGFTYGSGSTVNTATVLGLTYNINYVTINMAALTAGLSSTTVYPGQTAVAAFGFSLATASGTATISGININSNNGSLSTYYSNFKLYSNTTNDYSTGTKTLIGTAATASGAFVNFGTLSVNQNLTTTAQYYFLVADVSYSGAGTNSTAFNFTSGQSTNALIQSSPSSTYNTFTVAGNSYNITQPSTTLGGSLSNLASGNLIYGSTVQAISGFSLQVTGIASLKGLVMTEQGGIATSSEFANVKLYRGLTSTFDATLTGYTLLGSGSLSGSTITFSSISDQVNNTTQYYYMVVDDIYFNSSGHTQLVITSLTMNSTTTSPGAYQNYYNFALPTVAVTGYTSTSNGITPGSLSYGQTDIVLFGFSVQVTGGLSISGFNFSTSSAPNGYFSNARLYRSSTANFPGGTPLYTSSSVAVNSSQFAATVNETISNTTYYYWLVADYTVSSGSSGSFSVGFNYNGNVQSPAAIVVTSPSATTYNTYYTTTSFTTVNTIDWTGATNTDITNAANYLTLSGGSVGSSPTGSNSSTNITIGKRAVTSNRYPIITTAAELGKVTFDPTTTAATTLTISGGSLKLNGGLVVENGASATITGGTVTLPSGSSSYVGATAKLTLGASTTIANSGTFTLKSSATGTATIAAIPATSAITGTVVAERYISASRGYRLLSSPVYTGTVYTKNAYTPASLLTNTIITGPGTGGSQGITSANSNGFDVSATGASSIFAYKESDADPSTTAVASSDYKGFASINQYLPVSSGLMLFYRGNRSLTQAGNNSGNVFTSPYPTALTATLTFTGTINSGSIAAVVPTWVSTTTYYDSGATTSPSVGTTATGVTTTLPYTTHTGSTNDGFNLLGNPYPATIDLEALTFTNVGSTVYTLNSSTQSFGTYVRSGSTSTDGVALNGASRYVLSGEGFFVKANSSGTAGVTFAEAAKTSYPSGNLTSTGTPSAIPTVFSLANKNPAIRIRLVQDTALYNESLIAFNSQNVNTFEEGIDASYFSAPGQSVFMYSYTSDGAACVFNRMNSLENVNTIKLFASGSVTGSYQMQFAGTNSVDSQYMIYLKDAFTGDSVNIATTPIYTFNIDRNNAATYGAARFTLVVHKANAGKYQLLTFSGAKTLTAIKLNWTTLNEGTAETWDVQRSIDGGKTFVTLGTVQSSSLGAYSYTDNAPVTGTDIYRLQQSDVNDAITYSDLVSFTLDGIASADLPVVSMYPNPAVSTISIDFTQRIINPLQLNIISTGGKIVKQTTLDASQHISQDVSALQTGIYIVDIYDATTNQKISSSKLVKN